MSAFQGAEEPLLAPPNVIRIDPTSTRRRKTHQTTNRSNGNLLSRFSRWNQYKLSSASGGDSAPKAVPSNGLGRRISVRRTDFTNKQELDHFNRRKKFIFHRGFFRRNTTNDSINFKYRSNRPRLKNSAELNAALQYVDLSTLALEEVIPVKDVVIYKPTHLRQRTPAVVVSSMAPLDEYSRSLGRKASVRRPLLPNKPPEKQIPRTTASSTPKRSLTTPASIKSLRRSRSPHSLHLQELWKEYLLLVIRQRLHLRISLLKDFDDNTNDNGISLKLGISDTRETLHSSSNSIAAASAAKDDVEDASINSLAAKRKAF